MEVLFVCSGNSDNVVNVIIENQGISLINQGVGVNYYPIQGKGIKSYIENIFKLRQHLNTNKYDIIHAHYSFSGIVSSLAGGRPTIVSLMGSDLYSPFPWKILIRFFSRYSWHSVIVKSQGLAEKLRSLHCQVIPNGVNLSRFKPLNQQDSRIKLGLESSTKYVLFASDPTRPEKNFSLAKSALRIMEIENVELLIASKLPNSTMPLYYSAADVLLMTSMYEGSPNVIKEALACNLPIVSTDVGDVREIISPVIGCHICKHSPEDLAFHLTKTLRLKTRSNGRARIKSLRLESESIAKRIIELYDIAVK